MLTRRALDYMRPGDVNQVSCALEISMGLLRPGSLVYWAQTLFFADGGP